MGRPLTTEPKNKIRGDIGERMLLYIRALKKSQTALAKELGTSQANVSSYVTGRNSPPVEFFYSLLKNDPSLNPKWLLTGEGDMFLDASAVNGEPTAHQSEPSANEELLRKQLEQSLDMVNILKEELQVARAALKKPKAASVGVTQEDVLAAA